MSLVGTELLAKIKLICERRGGILKKVESVPFNCVVSFGLADGYQLLEAEANVFYWIERLNVSHIGTALSGLFHLVVSSNGSRGSAGPTQISVSGSAGYLRGSLIEGLETEYMEYDVSGHSGGSCFVYGEVYKITYE